MNTSLLRSIQEARRALDCGRALFRENLVPECHTHFMAALTSLLAAWATKGQDDPSSQAGPPDQDADVLAALERAGYPSIDRLRAVREAAPGAAERHQTVGATPQVDLDVTWGEIERLYRFTVWHLNSPWRRPRIRLLAGLAAGATFVLMAVVVWRLWGRSFATASAAYSPRHAAANAIDGTEATEWLLPDGGLGWLQVNFPSPRMVRHVRLLNAHNLHYLDRGCERVRVTLYCQHQVAAAAEGSFAGIEAGPSPLDFTLGADCVSHVRVEVLSYFERGGGLAEIEID